MSARGQAIEWVRNVQLARAHFDCFSVLHSAYDRAREFASPEGAYFLLAYQAVRNSVIIHMAAALDRSRGAIKVEEMAGSEPNALQILRELRSAGVAERIKFVRDKTIGHRSATHSNASAWDAAQLREDELSDTLARLEALKETIAERHEITPYVTAYGATEGLTALVEHALR